MKTNQEINKKINELISIIRDSEEKKLESLQQRYMYYIMDFPEKFVIHPNSSYQEEIKENIRDFEKNFAIKIAERFKQAADTEQLYKTLKTAHITEIKKYGIPESFLVYKEYEDYKGPKSVSLGYRKLVSLHYILNNNLLSVEELSFFKKKNQLAYLLTTEALVVLKNRNFSFEQLSTLIDEFEHDYRNFLHLQNRVLFFWEKDCIDNLFLEYHLPCTSLEKLESSLDEVQQKNLNRFINFQDKKEEIIDIIEHLPYKTLDKFKCALKENNLDEMKRIVLGGKETEVVYKLKEKLRDSYWSVRSERHQHVLLGVVHSLEKNGCSAVSGIESTLKLFNLMMRKTQGLLGIFRRPSSIIDAIDHYFKKELFEENESLSALYKAKGGPLNFGDIENLLRSDIREIWEERIESKIFEPKFSN